MVDRLEEGRLHDEVVDVLIVRDSDLMEEADLGEEGEGLVTSGRWASDSSPPEYVRERMDEPGLPLQLQGALTSKLNSLLV